MEKSGGYLSHAERVLGYIKSQKNPVAAYEILKGLRADGITAPTTVYRALEKLHKDGRIHRIESLKAWTTCCDPNHEEAAVFEICKDCGNVTEHINKRLMKTLAALSERSGFSPKHSVMEIHGSCKDCETQLEKL
jgi:Fur family zinc uptake transcriptional regulator